MHWLKIKGEKRRRLQRDSPFCLKCNQTARFFKFAGESEAANLIILFVGGYANDSAKKSGLNFLFEVFYKGSGFVLEAGLQCILWNHGDGKFFYDILKNFKKV